MCFLLTYGRLRMQWETIQDLKEGLEEKVAVRTKELEDALPDVTYKKSKHLVGEQNSLYIFSDGVYEVEKSDGTMWQFNEFTDFMNNIKSGAQTRLDHLYHHAENINNQDNFEDDFTIVEVAFG